MAKGDIAKNYIVEKLKSAFGSDYIGEYNKKYYVWVDDGGERVQISITLTCPKTPVATIEQVDSDGGINFDNPQPAVIAPTGFTPAEITEEEKANVATLLERLGL
jgi:hypothetical protein